jgi:hypothetical protein
LRFAVAIPRACGINRADLNLSASFRCIKVTATSHGKVRVGPSGHHDSPPNSLVLVAAAVLCLQRLHCPDPLPPDATSRISGSWWGRYRIRFFQTRSGRVSALPDRVARQFAACRVDARAGCAAGQRRRSPSCFLPSPYFRPATQLASARPALHIKSRLRRFR